MDHFRPRARRAALLVQELPDELLVYDKKRHQAHCLNRMASLIWRLCDGETTPTGLAERVGEALHAPIPEEVIWHGLDQLRQFDLLEAANPPPAGRAHLGRREMIVEVGGLIGVALPLVLSITAPIAADAQSVPGGPSGPSGPSGPIGPSGPSGPGS